jgi:hypothetical protein
MIDETAVADQPITDTADQSAIESAAQDSSAEATGSEQATGATTEVEQESTYSLPDEQSKVFPEDVLLEFAQNRYPELAKVLADPQLPESTRKNITQVIHDKLNGDIYIQKLKATNKATKLKKPKRPANQPPKPIRFNFRNIGTKL